jgi:hypothetical protein
MPSITPPELKQLVPVLLLLAIGCNQARYQPAEWKTLENAPVGRSGAVSEEEEREGTDDLMLTRFGQLTPWLDPRLSTGQSAATAPPLDWTGSTLPTGSFQAIPDRSSSTLPKGEIPGRIPDSRNSTLPVRNERILPGRTGSTLPLNRVGVGGSPVLPSSQSTLPLPLPLPSRPALRPTENRSGSTLPARDLGNR